MTLDLPSLKLCQKYSPKMCKVIKRVIEMITPKDDIKTKLYSLVMDFVNDVKDIVKRYNIPASVELHGSFSRDTWLADKRDADVFILFNNVLSREQIIDVLQIFERELKYDTEKAYAQHPYLRVKISDDFSVDLVPGFKVGKILSAVDRTPLHSEYLKKRLTDELKGEIRLLKAFLRGIDAYGAEIKVEGLSGYACELLILHYGSFLKTLEAFSEGKRIFIDFTESWKKRDAFRKFDTPIVLIDPVDPKRNATAALSWGTFNRISFASMFFLERPTINFFFPKILSRHKEQMKHYLNSFPHVILELKIKGTVPPDIYWGQAKRILRDIINFLKNQKYLVSSKVMVEVANRIYLIIFIPNKDRKFDIRVGPPINAKENVKKFVWKWLNKGLGPIIEDTKKISFLIPKEITIEDILCEFLKDLKIEPSFNSINIVTYKDVPLNNDVIKSFLLKVNPLALWIESESHL